MALPWADPDIAAVVHGDGPALVDAADDQGPATVAAVLGQTVEHRALAGQGPPRHQGAARSDDPRGPPRGARRSRPAGAGLPQGARVDLAVSARRRGTRVVRAAVADPAIDQLVATGGPAAVPQILADLAVTAASAPGQALLVTAPRDWAPDADGRREARRRAEGRRLGVVALLLDPRRVGGVGGHADRCPSPYSRTDRRRELPVSHVAAVAVAERRLAAFAPALDQR